METKVFALKYTYSHVLLANVNIIILLSGYLHFAQFSLLFPPCVSPPISWDCRICLSSTCFHQERYHMLYSTRKYYWHGISGRLVDAPPHKNQSNSRLFFCHSFGQVIRRKSSSLRTRFIDIIVSIWPGGEMMKYCQRKCHDTNIEISCYNKSGKRCVALYYREKEEGHYR